MDQRPRQKFPYGKRLKSCPFIRLRKMSKPDMNIYLDTAKFEEIQGLIKEHCTCFNKRIQEEHKNSKPTPDHELKLRDLISQLTRLR